MIYAATKRYLKNDVPVGVARRVRVFLGDLDRLRSADAGLREQHSRCIQEREQLHDQYRDTTVKNYLAYYRGALKRQGWEELLRHMRLLKAGVDRLKRDEQTKIWKKHEAQRPLDPKAMLHTMDVLLASERPLSVGVGLCLATGRRTVEVFKTGKFSKPEGPSVLFGGQVKTRGRPGTRFSPYRIPTLVDGERIVELVEVLRERWQFKSEDSHLDFTRCLSNPISGEVKREFGLDWQPHDLRAAWACLAYHLFAPKGVSQVVYFSKVLGHRLLGGDSEAGDMDVPLSYMAFYIDDERDTK